jgi:RNA polymerase sigma factor (sigma-70 family)
MKLEGKIIQHNSKEFEIFFKRYFTSLCIFSDKIIKNDIIAKDIVQDAFLNVWKSENKFENENAFKSYLYVVTKNLSINHIRKNKKIENNTITDIDIIDDKSIINQKHHCQNTCKSGGRSSTVTSSPVISICNRVSRA